MNRSEDGSNKVQVSIRNIDDKDRKMMYLMSERPEVSQAELSERLKISQPAVSQRIRKLEENGILARLIGTDVKKAQLFLAKVDITTNNVPKVLEVLEKCPLYLNCFLTSGRHNMTCLFVGENIRSIMSCVDARLRQNLPVENVEFDLIVTPTRPFIIPMKPTMERREITTCGADCNACTYYASERCLGCPTSIHYKGKLL